MEESERRDAFLNRVLQSCLGSFDIATMYLGLRLGLYQSLAADGPATSTQLAQRSGTTERYVREWLEQQTVSGLLQVGNPSDDAEARRYSLPPAHAEVLLDRNSLNFLGPYPAQMVSGIQALPALMTAFRNGGGVPYEAYGADCREGIAEGNRAQFVNLLGSKWFAAIPELERRLRSEPAAEVADIGCGLGWSSISIARAYPLARIHAIDLDQASIESARRNAQEAGVGDQIHFEIRNAAEVAGQGKYDLVTAFETIHDMSRPVDALAAMRRLVKAGGFVLIADEKVGETFSVDPGDIERLYYGFSVLHCLPAGMAEQPSAGTGTVMRPATLRRYAKAAGFRDVEILPVEHEYWRFYRLVLD
jgi:2-polyprenyl-3-methyl-5-hydroxy-6-metoxy-1,4-benzoquinol methylase